MAEREANEVLNQLNDLQPIMFERIVDKYDDKYGSIY